MLRESKPKICRALMVFEGVACGLVVLCVLFVITGVFTWLIKALSNGKYWNEVGFAPAYWGMCLGQLSALLTPFSIASLAYSVLQLKRFRTEYSAIASVMAGIHILVIAAAAVWLLNV